MESTAASELSAATACAGYETLSNIVFCPLDVTGKYTNENSKNDTFICHNSTVDISKFCFWPQIHEKIKHTTNK